MNEKRDKVYKIITLISVCIVVVAVISALIYRAITTPAHLTPAGLDTEVDEEAAQILEETGTADNSEMSVEEQAEQIGGTVDKDGNIVIGDSTELTEDEVMASALGGYVNDNDEIVVEIPTQVSTTSEDTSTVSTEDKAEASDSTPSAPESKQETQQVVVKTIEGSSKSCEINGISFKINENLPMQTFKDKGWDFSLIDGNECYLSKSGQRIRANFNPISSVDNSWESIGDALKDLDILHIVADPQSVDVNVGGITSKSGLADVLTIWGKPSYIIDYDTMSPDANTDKKTGKELYYNFLTGDICYSTVAFHIDGNGVLREVQIGLSGR